MTVLTQDEKNFFWDNGYLMVDNAVSKDLLQEMTENFAAWVEESRSHDQPYGEAIDGRARFDLEPGHSADTPALRRVNAPVEVSDAYFRAMSDSRMTDCVADLIGPNVKFHHSKINSKLPGGHTEVKWHQDFPFTPHTNDDVITALLLVDEVTQENGPLEIVAGSHKGKLHGLWHQGVFTGAVEDPIAQSAQAQAIVCTGKAGSVCLMHTCLLHGSKPNLSTHSRTLFISVYSAEDALPCSPNPMPTEYEGMIVRGEKTGTVRAIDFQMKLPQIPQTASFFYQQAEHE